jgi:HPt (histidine-containing phosphotransfer) domain-containing protein
VRQRLADLAGDSKSEVVDLGRALARVGGDRELYYELLDMLFEDAAGRIGDMREAIDRGDAKRVEQTAHSLKGAAANLEAGPLRDVALWLETLGRENRLMSAECALAELEVELERLHRFVETLE